MVNDDDVRMWMSDDDTVSTWMGDDDDIRGVDDCCDVLLKEHE